MAKIERMAAKNFLRLSKKEQKHVNNLNRIPTSKPGFIFEGRKDKSRIKRWDAEVW